MEMEKHTDCCKDVHVKSKHKIEGRKSYLWFFFFFLLLLLLTDAQADRSFKGKKPNLVNDGPLVESSGYNPKRQEFDPEYDNDAEQLLADMEFKDNDTEEERELKLRVLRIYSKRYTAI